MINHSFFCHNEPFSCHTDTPCHTEALAEVSIKLGCALNSMDISPTAQYDKRLRFSLSIRKLKMTILWSL